MDATVSGRLGSEPMWRCSFAELLGNGLDGEPLLGASYVCPVETRVAFLNAIRAVRLHEWGVARGRYTKGAAHGDPLPGGAKSRVSSNGNGNTIVDCLSLAMVFSVVR